MGKDHRRLDLSHLGSGSEAVEAVVKTAALATGRSRVVAFEGGYHGMSLGILSASHYRQGFRVPFQDLLGGYADWLPFGASEKQLRDFLGARTELPAAAPRTAAAPAPASRMPPRVGDGRGHRRRLLPQETAVRTWRR